MVPILENIFKTPFQSFPFSQVNDTDYNPVIETFLKKEKAAIESIAANPEAPTFENTLVAMEQSGKQMNRVVSAFFNLHSADTNEQLEQTAQHIAPLLAAFSNDILLNQQLFERIKSVYNNEFQNMTDQEDKRLLEKSYMGFVRNGALLNPEEKDQLRRIDQELAQLKVKFAQNVLQETNNYQLHLINNDDIEGIPESILSQAKNKAAELEKEGYVFTLQQPSYVPFMKYATNRSRRKEMYIAYAKRAFNNNAHNNETVIHQIVTLKQERAILLGYKHHAQFVLEERMANSYDKVNDFLQELLLKAKPYAVQELEALKSLAAKDGISEMMPYDHAYYAEKLKQQKFSYSEEALKPYFPLDQVLNAAFGLANKLFGLSFEPLDNIDTYHSEVTVYNVLENGKHKALLYTDFFPREGKRAGAWMTNYKGQYFDDNGHNSRPHISIVCNFNRPDGNIPSLLTYNEVTTLFHEFGHALHGIMADTKYETLSGTNVYWDFVELPSQFLENYCAESEFLKSFAKHWQTKKVLDDNTISKIVASSNFMEGYQTLRQLSFGLLDMAYHTNQLSEDASVSQFEKEVIAPTQLYPVLDNTAISPAFSHIFAGGYDAGYYSYKWAEVLDADAFAYFKESDIFNTEIAAKYKYLLSQGGTKDPMDLYTQFRGRAPQIEALLTRAGLIDTKEVHK